MIKFAAHTMATPEMDIRLAAELVARLGYDGLEVIFQQNYKCGLSEQPSSTEIDIVRKSCTDTGIEIVCLVPYVKDFGDPDPILREASKNTIQNAIRTAAQLGAHLVRILPGQTTYDDDEINRMAELLHSLAYEAAAQEVTLVVENHMDTAFETAAEMVAFVKIINHPNVGILYDPANLYIMGNRDSERAFQLQKSFVRHVHINDAILDPMADQPYTQRLLGDGELDWADCLRYLREAGYEGWITAEYGVRWFANILPPPDVGLVNELNRIRSALIIAR